MQLYQSEPDTAANPSSVPPQSTPQKEVATATAAELQCGINLQSLEKEIADQQRELTETALGTFATMRAKLERFFES